MYILQGTQDIRQAFITIGPYNKIQCKGLIFQQFLFKSRSHTSQDTDRHRPALTAVTDLMDLSVHLPMSRLPYRTGIKHHNVRQGLIRHERIPRLSHDRPHQLGVVFIHLTTKSLKKNFIHMSRR